MTISRIIALRLQPEIRSDGVAFIRGSVLDRETVAKCVAGADFVFHLAANPNLWARDQRTFSKVNLDGTQCVLDAARAAECRRIVYTSTESILVGHRRRSGQVDEAVSLSTDDVPGAYCRSKLLAEQYARRMAAEGAPISAQGNASSHVSRWLHE